MKPYWHLLFYTHSQENPESDQTWKHTILVSFQNVELSWRNRLITSHAIQDLISLSGFMLLMRLSVHNLVFHFITYSLNSAKIFWYKTRKTEISHCTHRVFGRGWKVDNEEKHFFHLHLPRLVVKAINSPDLISSMQTALMEPNFTFLRDFALNPRF